MNALFDEHFSIFVVPESIRYPMRLVVNQVLNGVSNEHSCSDRIF